MHGYFHLYVMFLEYTCLNIHLFAWDNRVSYVRDLLCAHPSVLCVFRPVKAFILSSVFIWKLVLPLRITLITEEGSWEGRVLVGSSRFVRSTVQETERVEKNNKDCAVCFHGLGGYALRFDHTLSIRPFQQAAVHETSNSCQTIHPHYHEIHIKFI